MASTRISFSPKQLYVQVLIGVALGILVGYLAPEWGKSLKPLGDAFVKLIKMIIAPIIFCTVVHGIASMGDMKKLGRIGLKTLLYFEIVSTLALLIGLVVANTLRPGDGFNIDPATLDPKISQAYVQQAHSLTIVDFLLSIIPSTFTGAFSSGDLLQVLLVSTLVAFAIMHLGERRAAALHVVEQISHIFFGVMNIIVRLAPLGAFGAMAFTIGSYGFTALSRLLSLMVGFYLTAAVFVIGVLGLIAWASGFSIFRYLVYIKDELLLVFGTSSSETALPGLIQKSRRLGCSETSVGLVIPTGYSFNLDGTNIYITMAAIFLAQATNTPITLEQQVVLVLVAMITSKGAGGVAGAGFIGLAATLAAVPTVPIQSLALLVGIDRFMSECRALVNLIGNGVATVVISRLEGEVSGPALRAAMKEVPPAQPSAIPVSDG